MKKLSWAVTFLFKVAQVLPPNDPITVPMLRLLMAVDDVRRAQIQTLEAHERIEIAPAGERYRALGDFFYSMRLLFSHLHEARNAVRMLDSNAGAARVDGLLAGSAEAVTSLRAVRDFFNAADYNKSLVARVRNVIGFHYQNSDIAAIVGTQFTADSILESTVAEVGGLARMADPFVKAIIISLAEGDFTADEKYYSEVSKVLATVGHLLTFVDHLFKALLVLRPDALVEQRQVLVEIPPLVQRARGEWEAERWKVSEEETSA